MDKKHIVLEDNGSKTNILFPLKYWLFKTYVHHTCPECNEQIATYKELRVHIELNHGDAIKKVQKDYYNMNKQTGTCKKCQREYHNDFIMYKHTFRHRENTEELTEKKCKICSHIITKRIKMHFVELHPEVVDEFNKSGYAKKCLKCPICHNTYANNKYVKFWHHFMFKHPQENQEKFRYNCHLCSHKRFSDEELYFQHLMLQHELNSWNVLNFRKIFEDKEYLACLKCHRVYPKNDTLTFLKHYLEHESSSYWSCKFCGKKSCYGHNGHMCPKMMQYYGRRYKDVRESNRGKNIIKNLEEFEEYIAHVCPFCKEEFNKLHKWQQHLRSIHAIDTLKGLEMKVVATADNNKLRCVICHTMVANNPVQLHAHRFQHLPFKPYKCRHCKLTLATFKMAVNHVVKRCNDDEDRDYIKQVLKPNIINPAEVEIQCSFCNYQKFTDANEAFTHFQDEHNNFKEFFSLDSGADNLMSCIVCQKKVLQTDAHDLLKHVYTHFDQKIFKCPLCTLSYFKHRTCIGHMQKVHYFKPLNLVRSLKERDELSPNKEDVTEYQPTATAPQLAKPNLNSHVLNEFAEFINFACPECNEGISNQKDWHTHITTQHDFFDESNVSFKDSNGSLKCLTCKLNLPTVLTQRLKHKLTHMPYRSFICNLCYARCNSLGVLYGHFRRKHFAQGTFKCSICPEVLATSHQRTEHLKQTHPPNEWPDHICLICYKILRSKSSLNKHMETHDAERVKYTCDICGSKLIGRKDFKNHVDRHEERGEIKKENCDNDIPSQFGSDESKIIIADVMDVKTDLDSIGVEAKYKTVNLNNVEQVKPDLDNVGGIDLKSKSTNVNKRKSLRNSLAAKKKKCDIE
ncbi:zinc finger protein Xfin-like [Lucilia sericata]|uniref:zinc finger protein Xfin-like n=1 Tax=Lucilia sericata TaxID=13632 RepID=UPI0018A82CD4|nr:zinc finger protein Xfin-like [Lucilia sericata]